MIPQTLRQITAPPPGSCDRFEAAPFAFPRGKMASLQRAFITRGMAQSAATDEGRRADGSKRRGAFFAGYPHQPALRAAGFPGGKPELRRCMAPLKAAPCHHPPRTRTTGIRGRGHRLPSPGRRSSEGWWRSRSPPRRGCRTPGPQWPRGRGARLCP